MSNTKIKILGIAGEYNAVTYYRILNPIWGYEGDVTFKVGQDKEGEAKNGKIIQSKGLKENLAKYGGKFFAGYDIVITKYVGTKEDAQSVIAWKKASPKTKLFIDVDDNVFEIPKGNSAGTKWTEEKQNIFAFICKFADGIVCSTRPLMEYYKMLNKNVYLLPNMINPDRWEKYQRKEDNEKVKIGWTYSNTHIPDKKIVENVFLRLREKYGDKIEIETTGEVKGATDIVGCTFHDLPKFLRERNWDIAVAPLLDNEFNKGKSNIKWLESTMSGAVFVGSPVYPYRMSITHGETGFLCRTEEEWVETLSTLIEDKSLREKIRENAYKEVMENYNIKVKNPVTNLEYLVKK